MITSANIPKSNLANFVKNLAQKYNVEYVQLLIDDLADDFSKLSDDEVITDEIVNLIVALKRANVINAPIMITLLGSYLDEKIKI